MHMYVLEVQSRLSCRIRSSDMTFEEAKTKCRRLCLTCNENACHILKEQNQSESKVDGKKSFKRRKIVIKK